MAKKFLASLLVIATLAISQAHAEEEETVLPFSDVEEGTEYYDAISYLYNNEVVSGYGDGTFKPDQSVNRVEALKMLLESSGIEATAEEESIFEDVTGDEWYFPYLAEGLSRKIVGGYEDGTFKPEEEVNLVEFLKMFINTKELVPSQPDDEEFFPDAEADAWYASYLNFAAENGLAYVDSEGNINPDGVITRAELADIIYRYKNREYYSGEVEYGKATYYADMFEGLTTASGEKFDQNKMTCAHLTLPFGTVLRVTNVDNGQTVEVTVNDRGPYAHDYVLDLSKVAFQKLSHLGAGVLNTKYEIVYPEQE